MNRTVKSLTLACVSLIIISIMFTGESYAKFREDAIVGIWLFDKGTGKTVEDFSGNGHDGEIVGDIEWTKEGKFGNALSFPGTGLSYVSIPHDDSMTLTTFTMTAWIKLEESGNFQAIMNKTEPRLVENYCMWVKNPDERGVFYTRFTHGGERKWDPEVIGTTTVTDGKWHHVAGTYDQKNELVYVDGTLEAEEALSAEPDEAPGPLRIGAYTEKYTVKGIIDEVGLFNAALSKDEIKEVMTEGLRAVLAVSPKGKLAIVWGKIKVQ